MFLYFSLINIGYAQKLNWIFNYGYNQSYINNYNLTIDNNENIFYIDYIQDTFLVGNFIFGFNNRFINHHNSYIRKSTKDSLLYSIGFGSNNNKCYSFEFNDIRIHPNGDIDLFFDIYDSFSISNGQNTKIVKVDKPTSRMLTFDTLGNLIKIQNLAKKGNLTSIKSVIDHKNNLIQIGKIQDSIIFDSINFFNLNNKNHSISNSIALAKFDIDNYIKWSNFISSNNTLMYSKAIESNGIYTYIEISFFDTLVYKDVDSTYIFKGSKQNSNILLVKLNSFGKYVSHKIIKTFQNRYSNSIVQDMSIDNSGNLFLNLLIHNSILEIDSHRIFSKPKVNSIVCLNNKLEYKWHKNIETEMKLDIESNEDLFLSMYQDKAFKIDEFILPSCKNCNNLYFFRIDSLGKIKRIFKIKSKVYNYEVLNNYIPLNNIFVNAKNEIYSNSFFQGDFDMDPTSKENIINHPKPGENRRFIFKYSDINIDQDSIDLGLYDLSLVNKISEITFYPNPFTNELKLDLENFEKDVLVELFDLQGRKVLNQSFQNKKSITLKTDEVFKGNYILKLKTKAYEKDYKVQKE